MSEPRTGRELTPRDPDGRPTRRESTSVDRFYAGDSAHTVGLTEERAAGIVKQSGSARNIAFLAILVIVLFVPLYWFYDLGFPAVAGSSRLENEKKAQQVTDVSRGYKLYLANCAQCHGPDGKGGVGPPLNDQAKLYNAVTPAGLPGKGHLNPDYIRTVLENGGRYVCGDPNSVMPVWADTNGGPLNYRQIEELISFITASKEISWEYQPDHPQAGQTLPPAEKKQGWRDPSFQPPAGASPIPACWRDPDGIQIGPNASAGGGNASAAPVENPGTKDKPRVIKVQENEKLQITDEKGAPLTQLAVKKGETVKFEVTNVAGFDHNFYVGTEDKLKATQGMQADLPGVPAFATGTQSFTQTFEDVPQNLQFACLVPGHYGSMHGNFQAAP